MNHNPSGFTFTSHMHGRDIAREKWADAEQVRRLNVAIYGERRARPRCTHTAENMMRMEGDCPACTPNLDAQLISAPEVEQGEE